MPCRLPGESPVQDSQTAVAADCWNPLWHSLKEVIRHEWRLVKQMTIRGKPQKREGPGPLPGGPGLSGEKGTLASPDGLPGRPVDPEGEGGDPWVQLSLRNLALEHRSPRLHSNVSS